MAIDCFQLLSCFVSILNVENQTRTEFNVDSYGLQYSGEYDSVLAFSPDASQFALAKLFTRDIQLYKRKLNQLYPQVSSLAMIEILDGSQIAFKCNRLEACHQSAAVNKIKPIKLV